MSERILKSKKIVKNIEKVKVLYLENKVKSSRTINLIKYFLKTKKQKKIYLIIGSDNLINFHKWTSWKKIVKLTKLVVFSRRGYDKKGRRSKTVKYLKKENIIFIKNKSINVSSSNLRKGYFKNIS